MPNNFVTRLRANEVGAKVVIFAANSSSSRFTNAVIHSDSTRLVVCFNEGGDLGSMIEKMEAPGGSRMLDIGLPRLELIIQNARNSNEFNIDLIELQQEKVCMPPYFN
jgi:hypothetical protein